MMVDMSLQYLHSQNHILDNLVASAEDDSTVCLHLCSLAMSIFLHETRHL